MSEDLQAQVAQLTKRLAKLEAQMAALQPEIPEEHLVVIAAAVAGYLGHRAKIRQVRFAPTRNWMTATRTRQQQHHPLYLR